MGQDRKMAKRSKEADDAFMHERSHKASESSYEIGKSAAQACLLINGGAATALLALLGKEHVEPGLWQIMPWCLGLFASGVSIGAAMMFCVMKLADEWNYFWYWMSYGDDEDRGRSAETNARWWGTRVNWAFWLSIGCFSASCTVFTCRALYIASAH
jgi:hypothetical protein